MAVTIQSIEIAGAPVQVWDHANKASTLDFADAGVVVFRDVDGNVSLIKSVGTTYRMFGPDFFTLSPNATPLYVSAGNPNQDVNQDQYSYNNFMSCVRSEDGQTFYAMVHMEWYAVVKWDADNPGDQEGSIPSTNGFNSFGNSQATSTTLMRSTDKGATWSLYPSKGNNMIAAPGFVWYGSTIYNTRPHTWLHAQNDSGLSPGVNRLITEVSPTDANLYYYLCGALEHRDFSTVNQAAGQYQAAQLRNNRHVLLRTLDYTNPRGWKVRLTNGTWATLDDQPDPITWYIIPTLTDAGWFAGWFYDEPSGQTVLNYPATHNDEEHQPADPHAAVMWSASPSLENPVWSTPKAIVGSAGINTDPLSADGTSHNATWLGFNDPNYPTITDAACPGYNFDKVVAGGDPWMFWSTYRNSGLGGAHNNGPGDAYRNDIWRIPLHFTYAGETAPLASFTKTQQPGSLTVLFEDTSV